MFVLVWLLALLFVYFLYHQNRHPSLFPPHPKLSIPIIGDLLHFKNNFASGLRAIKHKTNNGDIFGFLLGGQRVVVLCNYDLIQEVCKRLDMNGRMVQPTRAKAKGSEDPWDVDKMPGVVHSQGQGWQEQRRFMMHTLKDISLKENNSERIIVSAVDEICTNFRSRNGAPTDLKLQFNVLSVRVLWKLCTGETLSLNDPQLAKMVSLIGQYLQVKSKTFHRLAVAYPSFAYLTQRLGLWDIESMLKELLSGVKTKINTIKTESTNKATNTFINRYDSKIEEQNILMRETTFVGKMGQNNLVNDVYETLVAASHAPNITLKWAMLLMIQYTTIQEKIHLELDTNIGKGVQPRISDHKKTPYVSAFLMEVHRFGRVTDLSVPHRSITDCYLSTGHYIPKGTMVLTWLGEAMRDPKHFPNPDKFDPNRFLDSNGSFLPHSKVIPFGLGKRRCSGEIVAQDIIYLVFTGIMTRFKLEKAIDQDDYPVESSSHSLPPFQLKFIQR